VHSLLEVRQSPFQILHGLRDPEELPVAEALQPLADVGAEWLIYYMGVQSHWRSSSRKRRQSLEMVIWLIFFV
jgi:hypothetical protein